MDATIQKWGNSHAIRIPKPVLDLLFLKENEHVSLDANTKTSGTIMCEQAKCLDILARNASFIETVPNDVLNEAIDLICSFVE